MLTIYKGSGGREQISKMDHSATRHTQKEIMKIKFGYLKWITVQLGRHKRNAGPMPGEKPSQLAWR